MMFYDSSVHLISYSRKQLIP